MMSEVVKQHQRVEAGILTGTGRVFQRPVSAVLGVGDPSPSVEGTSLAGLGGLIRWSRIPVQVLQLLTHGHWNHHRWSPESWSPA